MKKIYFLLLPFLFLSCWIEPKVGEWEQKGNTYYFEDFDTMNTILRPEINKTFSDWHWNNKNFEEKYDKYLNNIKVSADYIPYLKKLGYEYMAITGSTSQKIQCISATNKRVYIEGKYYIIIRNNGDAVAFFSGGRNVPQSEPDTEFPFNY